jgi:hypothetical protein
MPRRSRRPSSWVDGQDVELWQRERKIASFEQKEKWL